MTREEMGQAIEKEKKKCKIYKCLAIELKF